MSKEKQRLLDIDLDKPFAFHCKTHGLVFVKVSDHMGKNEEQVVYGCYRCGDKRALAEKSTGVPYELL